MPDEPDESGSDENETKKDRIINALQDGMSRDAIAEELDTTPQYVSQVKSEEDISTVKNELSEVKNQLEDFRNADETETHEEDTYWCAYCEAENGTQNEVEYLAEECSNGHDLSNDW